MNQGTRPIIDRLRKGLGAQVFGQAVTIFIRLAEVPLFLAYWGPDRYGEWLMVAAIPAYLAMADGGFTSTTQREMTMRMGAGDRQGALSVFQSTWMLLLIVSTVVMAAAAVAAVLLPLDHWFNLKSMPRNTLTIVILLLASHVVVSFQGSLIYGGYCCEGRYARGTFLIAVMYMLDFGGLSLAVIFGGGPVEAALGFLVGRLVGLLLFLYDRPKVAPWLSYGRRYASRDQVVRLFRPSLASMAFPLGEVMNIQGLRIAVGMVLGPVAVTVFSSIRVLSRIALNPILRLTKLTEPEMALAFGNGNHDLMRKLFARSSQLTLWTVLPVCAMLWYVGEPLLHLWTHGKITLDAPLLALLLLASVANSIWLTALMVSFSTNRHEGAALFYAAVQCSAVLVVVLFANQFGLTGVGCALVITEIMLTIWVLPQALRLTAMSFASWIRTVASPPIFLFGFVRKHSRSPL